jgi:hypothetical protein
VVYVADIPAANVVGSDWSMVADSAAAAGHALKNPDLGGPKRTTAAASPASYVDVPFEVQAGVAYHVWVRMKAQNNSVSNDSIYAQFSGAVDSSGRPIDAIGTTAAAAIILEAGTNAGVSGWGWTDMAYGALAAPVYFRSSGPQTMRIQVREDGPSIDQIVISPVKYLTTAPGAARNDATIVPKP